MKIDGVRCIGHNGGFPGANGELLICESGYTIAMLANFDPPAASRIAMRVVRALPKSAGCSRNWRSRSGFERLRS